MMLVQVENHSSLPINVKEVLRYLNCKQPDEQLLKLIDEKACTFTFNEDKLVINVGDSNTEVDVKYSGVETSITFNSNYMINCLKNIDSEVVEFGFINNRTGVTLSTDKELTLLMPIVRL
jgi:DNA polymerase III sliding clamp (beta) subunit (PCNA family)